MAKSKEDAETWMEAIKKAASTTKISNRQSEILEQLRLSGEGEEDTSSINYDDVSNGNNNSPFENFDETYNDVGQQNETPANKVDLQPDGPEETSYDERPPPAIESSPPQPIRPSKPPPPPVDLSQEDDEEMYDDVGVEATPPQPVRPSQPISEIQPAAEDDEELYDDVGVSEPPPPPQPERPPQQKRPVSEIQPTTEEEEELYDDVQAFEGEIYINLL